MSRALRRKALAAAGCLILLGLAAGHVVFWYLPRAHTARPSAGTLTGQLLASEQYSFAAWLPFPHQNLAALERATAARENGVVEAIARLGRLPAPTWPSFGPLTVPPSREIVFAADGTGERFAIFAEVYPSVAAFARLAGRLAGNPWLAGGVLELEGRRVEVTWRGRVWTVSSPGLPELTASGPSLPAANEPESLLAFEIRRNLYPLPAGRFWLTGENGDLLLRGAAPVPQALEEGVGEMSRLDLFLLVVEGRQKDRGEPAQAMAFFTQESGGAPIPGGDSYEMPGMAVICESGAERWSLPGEKILEWTGREPQGSLIDGFEVAAIGAQSFSRAERLVPRFLPLVGAPDVPRDGDLLWGLWIDLGAGLGEVSRIAAALDGIPIVARRHKERWRDAEKVLSPLAERYSHLSLVVTGEPRALHLRLTGRDR